MPLESARNVIKNLRRYGKNIDTLVLFLDDDVEGDSIGQDVCDIVQAKRERKIDILRAHFSSLTEVEMRHAIANLEEPRKFSRDAIKLYQEIDLRLGTAFTRLQTIVLRDCFKHQSQILSFQPSLFAALGLIYERHQ